MTHLETILTIQGWFYIATGIWPVIHIYYSWRKVIRKIYLLDAVVELGFVSLYVLK